MPLRQAIGVMDEDRLEDPFLMRNEEVMHDPIAKVRGKDFPRLWPVGDEANGAARRVCVRPELLLQRQQVRLGVHLEGQGVCGIALVAAALAIVPPQRVERIQVRADHEPPRTASTRRLRDLLPTREWPSTKPTPHALPGLMTPVLDDQ